MYCRKLEVALTFSVLCFIAASRHNTWHPWLASQSLSHWKAAVDCRSHKRYLSRPPSPKKLNLAGAFRWEYTWCVKTKSAETRLLIFMFSTQQHFAAVPTGEVSPVFHLFFVVRGDSLSLTRNCFFHSEEPAKLTCTLPVHARVTVFVGLCVYGVAASSHS